MFGNLFSPSKVKKEEPVSTTQGAGFEVNMQQTTGADLLGDVNRVEEKVTVTGGAPAPAGAGAQSAPGAPAGAGQASLTASPEAREKLTALSRLDPRATQVLHQAKSLAKKNSQATIEPDHLLYGLLYDSEVFKLLEKFNVDVAKISQEIESKQTKGAFSGQPTLSAPSNAIIEEAFGTAKLRGASFVAPEDILLAVFGAATTSEFLKSKGIEKQGVEEKLSKSADYTVAKKSMIDKYSIDLTVEAREGRLDPVTGRDREITRLIHILLRRTKNNPIIIGEAGVGKTAIVEGLAQKIVEGSVPKELSGRRIMQLDMASLIAGASHRGEFEERFRAVIKEAQASAGQVILFIDEIHSIIGAGDSEGTMDASNIIKPYLARGQIQLIGTTTTAEYRKYFEKDKAFERRFQPVLADEPDEEAAIEMLKVLQPKYEKFHNVAFTPESLDAAARLSKKYVGERFLPDKAVDLLDEAAAEVKLKTSEGKRDNKVIKEDIQNVVSAWTGIPITKLTEDESEKLIHLEDLIHKRFVDQEEAVVSIAEAIRRGRIGLSAANRPIASFIFLGPTGVGKTELAKTMAEILFGKEEAMVRLDMSEYMEKHEVAKLIGAPPGYVGYEEGGQLTEAVRLKPYSIVLLDEIEKAHPDVFNILLQLLEDGRLTDNKGNTISFKNTVIIATSNIGSPIIQKELSSGGSVPATAEKGTSSQPQAPGTPPDAQTANKTPDKVLSDFEKKFKELTKVLLEELRKFFRPELLNRFDELVVFKPLALEDMSGIAKLNISKTKKLLAEQGLNLEITQKALDELAKEGYDPVYGARPLRRLIQTAIENPISVEIISKKFVTGDTILIDFDGTKNEFVFTKRTPAPGAVPTAPGAAGTPQNVQPNAQQTPSPGQQVSPGELPPAPPANGQSITSEPIYGAPTPTPSNPLPGNPPPTTDGVPQAGGVQMQKSA